MLTVSSRNARWHINIPLFKVLGKEKGLLSQVGSSFFVVFYFYFLLLSQVFINPTDSFWSYMCPSPISDQGVYDSLVISFRWPLLVSDQRYLLLMFIPFSFFWCSSGHHNLTLKLINTHNFNTISTISSLSIPLYLYLCIRDLDQCSE